MDYVQFTRTKTISTSLMIFEGKFLDNEYRICNKNSETKKIKYDILC